LARNGNNLFGIKADSRWRGETLTLPTKEFIKGQWVVVTAKWRKYESWQASIDDHAAFLRRNSRYKACFACTTAQDFAKALSQAGYATDPAYADKVVSLIKKHNLLALDGGAP
jgi:flagellum-specific peptidoglycan hydrolase FlgJ